MRVLTLQPCESRARREHVREEPWQRAVPGLLLVSYRLGALFLSGLLRYTSHPSCRSIWQASHQARALNSWFGGLLARSASSPVGLKYTARKSVPSKMTSISPRLTVMMSLSSKTAPVDNAKGAAAIQPATGSSVPGT